MDYPSYNLLKDLYSPLKDFHSLLRHVFTASSATLQRTSNVLKDLRTSSPQWALFSHIYTIKSALFFITAQLGVDYPSYTFWFTFKITDWAFKFKLIFPGWLVYIYFHCKNMSNLWSLKGIFFLKQVKHFWYSTEIRFLCNKKKKNQHSTKWFSVHKHQQIYFSAF